MITGSCVLACLLACFRPILLLHRYLPAPDHSNESRVTHRYLSLTNYTTHRGWKVPCAAHCSNVLFMMNHHLAEISLFWSRRRGLHHDEQDFKTNFFYFTHFLQHLAHYLAPEHQGAMAAINQESMRSSSNLH